MHVFFRATRQNSGIMTNEATICVIVERTHLLFLRTQVVRSPEYQVRQRVLVPVIHVCHPSSKDSFSHACFSANLTMMSEVDNAG